jgi:phage shock protein C
MEVATMGLQRSKKDRMIAGVCGGIAKTLGWNPTLVRVTYVLASVLSAAFPGILVYIILWILMPEENGEKLGVNY